MAKPWYKYPLMGRVHDFGPHWIEGGMAQKALSEGKALHTFFHTGGLKDELDFYKFMHELGATYDLKLAYHSFPTNTNSDDDFTWVGNDCAVGFYYTPKNRSISVRGYGFDELAIAEMRASVRAAVKRKTTRGRIYVVINSDSGPVLHEMGVAGEDFTPTNYRPEVVEGYKHIVADLNSHDPCGRIVILDGPPRTGKTHLVRALLNDVPKGTFVLVPSNMMSSLGSPSFLKALLREQKRGFPIIMVVEDADECLTARKSDNMSEMSALLNFSDGIFGTTLDLRIVATTNAKIDDLDEAVIGEGRLCRRIEVTKLEPEHAQAVYERLGGKEVALFTKGNYYTLGQVYRAARGEQAGTPSLFKQPAKGRIGFLPEADEEASLPSPDALKDLGVGEGDVVATDNGYFQVKDGELITMDPNDVEFDEDDEDDDDDLDEDDSDLIDEDPDQDD